jgi:hypothetical protein
VVPCADGGTVRPGIAVAAALPDSKHHFVRMEFACVDVYRHASKDSGKLDRGYVY